ncbi:MAG TPA: hypothetical protein PKC39_05820 [Ferruginibacter sp.]|nr:hypothetical protein [Ferruginibacter sp.]HMP20459.1 hypothetical protein [Ferruginibacter sp.]
MRKNKVTMMKNLSISALAITFCLTMPGVSKAQDAKKDESKLSFNLSLNHDAFFGFNPMLSGAYALNDKTDFTFYGIQWGAGTAAAWGNWTEFGLGANFKVSEAVAINPQLGFTFGNLLSSYTAGSYAIGDGVVPNVTVNINGTKLEGQVYAGYYAALRKKDISANYVHYWVNLGGKISSTFSVGAHVENLFRSGGKGQPTKTSQYYTWVGPYVQFSKGNAGLRLSAGANIGSDEAKANYDGDFYKMAFFFSF